MSDRRLRVSDRPPGTARSARPEAALSRSVRRTSLRRRVGLVAALLGTTLLAGCGGEGSTTTPATSSSSSTANAPRPGPPPATRPPRPDLPLDVTASFAGKGAQGAWIFRRKGATKDPVLLFLHGWTAVNPELYGPWLTHLVREGSTVVYPVYQDAPFLAPNVAFAGVVAGVRAAVSEAKLSRGGWIVAGHSAGAAMSADYAASAERLGLPPARAIFAAYPGRMVPGVPLRLPEAADPRGIPRSTRIVSLYGTDDQTVGDTTAKRIVARAQVRDEQLVRVDDPAVDDHLGPQRSGPATRRVFWRRLDALVVKAR